MSVSGKGTDVARTKDELDVERHFLGTTVRLTDGSEGLVFSRGPKNESNFFLYNCHLCGVPNLPGERCFQTHVTGRKHQTRLTQPIVDAISFRAPLIQKSKIQMNIAPGEPVPPGFENEVKPLAEIQTHIDVYKGGALIGIEYTIELVSKDDKESSYICLLCDKRGDPRTIFSHWSSYNHRLKYLEKHFPSVIKELVPYRYNPEARNVMPRIVQMITEAVEDHHGRLCPTVVENNEFARNRAKILQDVVGEKHFDEKSGPTFVNVIDRRTIDDLIKNSKGSIAINIDTQKKRDPSPPHVRAPKRLKSDSFSFARKGRDSLDSISSDSGSELIRDRQSKSPSYDRFGKKKRKSQSPAYRVLSRVKRSPPFEQSREPKERKSTLPTPKELSKQASEIAQERYKWEKYRCLVENATKDLEKVLKDHEKNPEKHPLYPDEWKKFWNRRYKELQLEKKDPNKHDFKPEWIVFWTKRMKELHDEEIEKKKIEIKKKIGLPEIGEEKTDQLKKQYKIKAPVKSERAQVIDISDDEESLSIHPKKLRAATTTAAIAAEKKQPEIKKQSDKANSLSRSLSPLSDDEFDNKKVKKASRFSDREREHSTSSRDRYAPPDYYRHPREWPRGYYPPPPGHYGYRTMDAYSYPQYEPPKKEEDEEPDDEPLTVVSVLRLLTALEDHLGSLGPKVVDLLAKALALEKVKANSADELLLNEDHSVFFETVKEKLKGQLIAHVLDTHKIKAVKKAIKNIAAIIHLVNEKAAKNLEEGEENKVEEMKEVKKPKAPPAKELPFDRQLIASKLAAALVMQERTDISTEDMDRLIQSFILMVKVSKERNEIIYVKDMLLELGIVTEELVEEQIEEEVMEEEEEQQKKQQQQEEEAEEELEKEITVDMFDINEEEQEETVPQPATALESLTDSDLQTLLQNFKHLSSEEQHHLIAHLKKLESTDPVRVEKLRKFVDISNLQQQGLEKEKTPPKSVAKESPPKKTSTNLYSDDEDEKLQKMIDSDDDDYNFEDVVKIASNNVKEKRTSDERRRPESISRDRDEDASNLSKASSNSVANLNMSLADTQNLIANLMGSLQKNSASFANLKPSTSKETKTTSLNIPTLISHSNNTSNQNANISYQKQPSQQQQQQLQQKQQQQQQLQLKQQQQQQQQLQQKQQQQQLQQNQQQQLQQKQQQQQQSIPQIRQENQNINRMNPANSNNFLQDNFNIANMQNIGYNPQNPANNFNTYNPFTNFPQQQPQMQPLQQTQILQDFILKQQNFRAQKHQSGSNF